MTEFLTGLFALDNLLCLFLFNIAITAIELGTAKPVAGTVEQGAFEQIILAALGLAWQFLGAMALGYVIGFLLSAWSLRVVEHGEQLILLAGCVLLCVGLAKWLEVSSLVANLTIGATVVNLSGRSRKLVESLSQTDPPLYAIFFVLAGADLDITKMRAVGIAGVLYVVARSVGKWSGTALGTRWVRAEAGQRAWLPSSMLAQAGPGGGADVHAAADVAGDRGRGDERDSIGGDCVRDDWAGGGAVEHCEERGNRKRMWSRRGNC